MKSTSRAERGEPARLRRTPGSATACRGATGLPLRALALLLAAVWRAGAEPCFAIKIVDRDTGRGVPLVELRTSSAVSYLTDSGGVVALCEPGLAGRKLFLQLFATGYELPGVAGPGGVVVTVSPGASATIEVARTNIAERLYRVTGEGIYRDTVLVGEDPPIREPLFNADVAGQDSVMAVPYAGRLHWFWGDTGRVAAPFGNFRTAGATSLPPGAGGLPPSTGVDLEYFVGDGGATREMCPRDEIPGPGPVWIVGLAVLPDAAGRERMVAKFERMRGLGDPYERGLVMWDDAAEHFVRWQAWPLQEPLYLDGHPMRMDVGGAPYLYFAFTPPYGVRVKAELASVADPAAYEAFTCLTARARLPVDGARPPVERDAAGRVVWGWKPCTAPIDWHAEQDLVASGALREDEAWIQLQDVLTGVPVRPHAGSVAWNEHRGRFLMLFQESRGLTDNGEVWVAEGDTALGPWVYARKVASHGDVTFYNPVHHPFLDEEGGRVVFFEGTYSAAFARNPVRAPRYNYNQLLYRLDLDHPRLLLPVPVYRVRDASGAVRLATRAALGGAWERVEEVPFYAADRPHQGLVAVSADADGRLHAGPPRSGETPSFWALPFAPVSDEERLSGGWACRLDGPGGASLPFKLQLAFRDGRATGSAGSATIVGGRLGSDELELHAEEGGRRFTMTARLRRGRLEGAWNAADGAAGTWSGERTEPTETLSAAVVTLHEQVGPDGARAYVVGDAPRRPGWRQGEPLCRVWRNPSSLLILERGASPWRP